LDGVTVGFRVGIRVVVGAWETVGEVVGLTETVGDCVGIRDGGAEGSLVGTPVVGVLVGT
jgi:hypothetical protein